MGLSKHRQRKGRFLIMGRYYAMHMHMHSCYEGKASMKGHMYQAKQLGMDAIWFTDHDSRMGRQANAVENFDFEGGSLFLTDAKDKSQEKAVRLLHHAREMGVVQTREDRNASFKALQEHAAAYTGFVRVDVEEPAQAYVELTDDCCHSGKHCMRISAVGSGEPIWQSLRMEFMSNAGRQAYSLLSELNLGLWVMPESQLGGDARILLDVTLSQQPPDWHRKHLVYVAGNPQGIEDEDTGVVEFSAVPGEWREAVMNLTQDIERFDLGGVDNAFIDFAVVLQVRGDAKLSCCFDDFSIRPLLFGDDVRSRQRQEALRLSEEYGIRPFVATEISSAGRHKLCLSTRVPIIDYQAHGYHVTHEEAIEWVERHGGIFSLNHPFDKWKRVQISAENRRIILEKYIREYIEARCWGAAMLEVGFPLGKHSFELCDYLELWDRIGLAGIFITGYGCSDNHANDTNWLEGNNFAAYIYGEALEEDELVHSMKAGNLFMADPARFKGEIRFGTQAGARMGQVISERGEVCLFFEGKGVGKDWLLRWVIDGKPARLTGVSTENLRDTLCFVPDGKTHLVRAELYDASRRCILLTNPIYFVDSSRIAIPPERM